MLALLAGPALVPQPPLLASRPAVARTSSIVAGDKLEPFDVKPFVKFTGRAKNRAERKQLYNSAGSFPPRTSNLPGEGYFFFQNSSPKTGVQKDLPGFFTAENFADAELDPKALPVLGVGAVCAAIIAGSTIDGTTKLPARTAPPPAVEKKAAAPSISLPKIEAPKISAPKLELPKAAPKEKAPPKPRKRSVFSESEPEEEEGGNGGEHGADAVASQLLAEAAAEEGEEGALAPPPPAEGEGEGEGAPAKRVAKPVDWVKAGTLRGKFSAAARKTVAVPRLPR